MTLGTTDLGIAATGTTLGMTHGPLRMTRGIILGTTLGITLGIVRMTRGMTHIGITTGVHTHTTLTMALLMGTHAHLRDKHALRRGIHALHRVVMQAAVTHAHQVQVVHALAATTATQPEVAMATQEEAVMAHLAIHAQTVAALFLTPEVQAFNQCQTVTPAAHTQEAATQAAHALEAVTPAVATEAVQVAGTLVAVAQAEVTQVAEDVNL